MRSESRITYGPELLDGYQLVDGARGDGCYPWDTTPLEYLEFAKKDIAQRDRRAFINAIGNAKRAIHAHVDYLLHNCGRCLRQASFPTKLGLLERLGIIAPSLLTKYNRLRNLIEHEYATPSEDEAQEVIDVAELFLEATRSYTYPLPRTLVFRSRDRQMSINVNCLWDDRTLVLVVIDPHGTDSGTFKIDGNESGDLWIRWVSRILRTTRDVTDPYVKCSAAETTGI